MQLIWTRVWKLNNLNCQIYFPHIFTFVGVFLGSLINCLPLTSLDQIYRKFFWEKNGQNILCEDFVVSLGLRITIHSWSILIRTESPCATSGRWLDWRSELWGNIWWWWDDWLAALLSSQMKRRERCWLARLWLERCFVRRMRYKSIRIISPAHLVFL